MVRIALGADAGGTAGGTAGTEELSARGFDVRLVVDQALAAREALVCVCVCVCVCVSVCGYEVSRRVKRALSVSLALFVSMRLSLLTPTPVSAYLCASLPLLMQH